MKFVKKLAILFTQLGMNPVNTLIFLRGLPQYIFYFIKVLYDSRGWKIKVFPILTDRFKEAGNINSQYFLQDLYYASLIFKNRPTRHLDIGSRIDGFISHLLVFMDVDVLDFRPIKSNIKGLNFHQVDIMSVESLDLIGKYPSVSCLHTIEHFGLGRYGDTFNVDGWKIGLENILSLVEDKGVFYLSTPIGDQRIEFNAHRVFSPKEIIAFVTSYGFHLTNFEYLDDGNLLNQSLDTDFSKIVYGCGFFVFTKVN